MCGWIKFHRSFLDWEWYSDINVSRVFIHLLLKVNFYDEKWKGTTVKRGQRVTSLSNLASETSLSVKQIRTVFKKLESTGEIIRKGTSRFTIITICNYEKWQKDLEPEGKQRASKGQTEGKQRATNKEVKKDKEVKNKTEPSKKFVPPELSEVELYFSEKGFAHEAQRFFDYYESIGWKVGKNPMKKWKNAASGWISRNSNQNKTQPNTPSIQDQIAKELLKDETDFKGTGSQSTHRLGAPLSGQAPRLIRADGFSDKEIL